MNMIKNIHFTLLIRINKQLHEFNFRMRSPELYDGDTSDERGNRHFFKMVVRENNWKIHGDSLPAWIVANEQEINDQLKKREAVS
ncbi:MAG: hypothetical protein ABUT20_02450 [Bacteroidota bacterium]